MDEYYQALVERDSSYEGIFFAGIKSTRIFCRPTCPAKKPKRNSCEFFESARDALLAGYRPCKRCRPMELPNHESALVKKLVNAVEASPEKRWRDADFRSLGVDASTVRRQFKKRFGMTFVGYARARRMGLAFDAIRNGKRMIDAQVGVGYESRSGFRDAFSKIMGTLPDRGKQHILTADWIDSPLGAMLAIADEEALLLLEFVDRRGLEREVEQLRQQQNGAIVPGRTSPIDAIDRELKAYFAGTLQIFQTPIRMIGSDFRLAVWNELRSIEYGAFVQRAGRSNWQSSGHSRRSESQWHEPAGHHRSLPPSHWVGRKPDGLCWWFASQKMAP